MWAPPVEPLSLHFQTAAVARTRKDILMIARLCVRRHRLERMVAIALQQPDGGTGGAT